MISVGPIPLPLSLAVAALAAFCGLEGELGAAEYRSRTGQHEVTASIDFTVQIVPACGAPDCKGVAIDDLGFGVHEVIVSAPGVYDRYITAQAPTYFAFKDSFTIDPQGVAVAHLVE